MPKPIQAATWNRELTTILFPPRRVALTALHVEYRFEGSRNWLPLEDGRARQSLKSFVAIRFKMCGLREMAIIGAQARYAQFDSRMGSMGCGKNLLVCVQERYGDLDEHWS